MNWKTLLTSSALAVAAGLSFASCEKTSEASTKPSAGDAPTANSRPSGSEKGPQAGEVEQTTDPAEIVAAPDTARLLTRVSDRWDAITNDDWIQAYDYLAPEMRGQQKLSQFLVGKEDHQYRNPGKPRLVAVEGERAYADIEVVWTPLHGQIMTADNIPQEGITQVLRMVETWVWHEGEWYWFGTERRNDFYQARADLK